MWKEMRQEESGEESSGRPVRAGGQIKVWVVMEKNENNQSKNWQVGTILENLPQCEHGSGRIWMTGKYCRSRDEMQVWEWSTWASSVGTRSTPPSYKDRGRRQQHERLGNTSKHPGKLATCSSDWMFAGQKVELCSTPASLQLLRG